MAEANLASAPVELQPYTITSFKLAEITGLDHGEVLQNIHNTFSGTYAKRFFDFVCTTEAVGIKGRKDHGGIIEFTLHKAYALMLLKRYGYDEAYAIVDKMLSAPPDWDRCPILPKLQARDERRKRKEAKDIEKAALAQTTTIKFIDLNDTDEVVGAVESELFLNTDFSRADPGHIYVIERSDGAMVKIGRSISPDDRVRNIHTISGGSARHYISNAVFDYKSTENTLHRVLASRRRTGEWFAIPFDLAVRIVGRVAAAIPAPGTKADEQFDDYL